MPQPESESNNAADFPSELIARAFGAENRARLLSRYFQSVQPVTTANAWQHVYRLLLWVDRTTALAHCYESDKAQPGRPWYARSLAFHDWVSSALEVAPAELGEHIDWLFREAVKDLASTAVATRTAIYERQRVPYAGRGFPQPGEDPELVGIIKEVLNPWISEDPPAEDLRRLTRQIYVYMTQENKRRNLVGEGFEDVIAGLLKHIAFFEAIEVRTRCLLHDLPGFHPAPPGQKPKRVDLALRWREKLTLVSAKWSIRADREEQFQSDFEASARLESAGQDFGYALITNEFDAARLKAACERRRQNAPLFSQVVHVNPEAVLATYANGGRGSAEAIGMHISSGRLMSLEGWLEQFEPTTRVT